MRTIKYTVTVSAEVERTRIIGKKWERGGYINAKEGGEYGYTPEVESTVSEDVELYRQSVEVLDVAALVAVVNKL